MKTSLIIATLMIALAIVNPCRGNAVGKPRFYVEMSDGWMRVYSVDDDDPHWLARVKTEVWAKALDRPLPVTQDDRRHFVLDLIAAAVAGGGEREKSTTDPNISVVTVEMAKQNGNPITATIERGTAFSILRDSEPEAPVYRAYIIVFPKEPMEQKKVNQGGAAALA